MSKLNLEAIKRELKIVSPDDFFFDVLRQISQRSNSNLRRQGALLVRDDNIISSASFDAYEETEGKEKVTGSGAAENLIANCARAGVSTDGAILYIFSFPNDIVCKILCHAGISEIKCMNVNEDSMGFKLCKKKNVKISLLKRS